jgi:hypothetical protein
MPEGSVFKLLGTGMIEKTGAPRIMVVSDGM